MNNNILCIPLVIALGAYLHAQTPPPLEVQLSDPVEVKRTVTEQTSTATIDWMLMTPSEAKLVAKVQPSNIEVKIEGLDYAALVTSIETKVRAGKTLREAFAETLSPHIHDAMDR